MKLIFKKGKVIRNKKPIQYSKDRGYYIFTPKHIEGEFLHLKNEFIIRRGI